VKPTEEKNNASTLKGLNIKAVINSTLSGLGICCSSFPPVSPVVIQI